MSDKINLGPVEKGIDLSQQGPTPVAPEVADNLQAVAQFASQGSGIQPPDQFKTMDEWHRWSKTVYDSAVQQQRSQIVALLQGGQLSPEEIPEIAEYTVNPDTVVAESAGRGGVDLIDSQYGDEGDDNYEQTERILSGNALLVEWQADVKSRREDRSYFSAGLELVESVVPFRDNAGWERINRELFGAEDTLFDEEFFDSATVIDRVRETYWNLDSVEEQRRYIDRLKDISQDVWTEDLFFEEQIIENILKFSKKDSMITTAMTGLEAGAIAVDVVSAGAATGIRSLTTSVAKGTLLGNNNQAKAITKGVTLGEPARIAQATKSRPNVDPLIDDVAMPEGGLDNDVVTGPSAAAQDILAQEAIPVPVQYTKQELQDAADWQLEKTREELAEIAEVKVEAYDLRTDIDPTRGTASVVYRLGYGGTNQPFVTEESADVVRQLMNRPDMRIVKGNGDGYFLEGRVDVTPAQSKTMKVADRQGISRFRQAMNWVLSADSMKDDAFLHSLRHLSHTATTNLRQLWEGIASNEYRWLKSNPKEREHLESVIYQGWKETAETATGQEAVPGKALGIWYSKDQFAARWRGRPENLDSAYEAYKSYRKISDALYLENNEYYRQFLVSKGVKRWYVTIDGEERELLARSVNNLVGKELPLNTQTGKLDTGFSDKLEKGWKILHVAEGSDHPYLLVPPSTLTGDLPLIVLKYTQGGTKSYANNPFFIKADNIIDGVRYRPTTLKGANTKVSAEKAIEDYNTALQALRQWEANPGGVDTKVVDDFIQRTTAENWRFKGIDDMRQYIEKFKIGDKPLRVVEEANSPRDFDNVVDEINTVGSLFNSRRTDRLIQNIDEGSEKLIDPWTIQDQVINRHIRRKTQEGYTRRLSQELYMYAKDNQLLNARGASADPESFIYSHKEFLSRTDDPELKRILNRIDNDIAGWRRSFTHNDAVTSGIDDLIYEKLFNVPFFKGMTREQMAGYNPINIAKNINFQFMLAMLSPRQYGLQGVYGSMQTTVLSPVAGSKAIGYYIPLRMALMNPNKFMTKLKSKVLKGEEVKEFESMFEDVIQSGVWRLGGEVQEMSLEETRSIIKLNESVWDHIKYNASDVSTFFFREGERTNRVVAWMASYLEERTKKGGDWRPTTPEEWAALQKRTNDLTFGMTTASKSGYNVGLASIPGQWSTYPLRFLERIVAGTGSDLTKAERARLLGFTVTATGFGGLVGGPAAYDLAAGVAEVTGSQQAGWAAYNGAAIEALNLIGEELGIEERFNFDATTFGPGFMEAVGPNILTSFYYKTDMNLYETLLGPTGSIIFDGLGGTAGDVVKLMLSGDYSQFPSLAKAMAKKAASQAKSLNDATRAYHMFTIGIDVDLQNKLRQRFGVSDTDALFRLLGFNSDFNTSMMSDAWASDNRRKVIIKDAVKSLRDLHNANNQGTLSWKDFQIEQEAILFWFNDTDRWEIMNTAWRQSGQPFAERYLQQMFEDARTLRPTGE
jgi:hypothetical protein